MASQHAAPTAQLKRELRASVRTDREAMSQTQLAAAGAAVAQQLRALVTELSVRACTCYLSVRGEPDTSEFLNWAEAAGIEVWVPASRDDGLLDWVRYRETHTAPGAFGIPEPIGEKHGPEAIADVDLMLIPAAAVDRAGHRLGWGRGYFDRALAAMPRQRQVYAVVHTHELLPAGAVPSEPHDMPITGVVTPAGITRC